MDIILLNDNLLPKRQTKKAFGFDVYYNGEAMTLYPFDTEFCSTGIKIDASTLNKGIAPILLPRSGLGCKGISLRNSVGLIDRDYQEEIKVCLYNNSEEPFELEKYTRIAQLIFVPVITDINFNIVEEFKNETERKGGFGSTGEK